MRFEPIMDQRSFVSLRRGSGMNHQSIGSDQRARRTLRDKLVLVGLSLLTLAVLLLSEVSSDVAWADEADGVDAAVMEATAVDDEALLSEEAIEDDETPLSAFDRPHCWTHWLMASGVVVTALYGVVVVRRRLGFSQDVDDFQDNILGRTPQSSDQVHSRVANHAMN